MTIVFRFLHIFLYTIHLTCSTFPDTALIQLKMTVGTTINIFDCLSYIFQTRSSSATFPCNLSLHYSLHLTIVSKYVTYCAHLLFDCFKIALIFFYNTMFRKLTVFSLSPIVHYSLSYMPYLHLNISLRFVKKK